MVRDAEVCIIFLQIYSVEIVHSVDNHTSRSKDGRKPFSCDAGVCYIQATVNG